jgi:hypothetical protein
MSRSTISHVRYHPIRVMPLPQLARTLVPDASEMRAALIEGARGFEPPDQIGVS